MADTVPTPSDQPRRTLILWSAFGSALLAFAATFPAWLRSGSHRELIDLVMQGVPPTSGAALLAGLCIGFVGLSPLPKPSLVTAITFPSMHVALTVALANLLSARPNALIEPMPRQIPIQLWLSPSTWGLALGVELLVFVAIALYSNLVKHTPAGQKC